MIERFVGQGDDQRDWLRPLHPVGRLSTGEKIAAAALYRALDAAKFTTGTMLLVGGGLTAQ